ncbi:MAG: hypothetical protein K0Q79_1641 [Flavipsychrobacter sp.]|jgi:hypothetical protein|nr:hypothetical protein [Flavipsychrobacter sp.]
MPQSIKLRFQSHKSDMISNHIKISTFYFNQMLLALFCGNLHPSMSIKVKIVNDPVYGFTHFLKFRNFTI